MFSQPHLILLFFPSKFLLSSGFSLPRIFILRSFTSTLISSRDGKTALMCTTARQGKDLFAESEILCKQPFKKCALSAHVTASYAALPFRHEDSTVSNHAERHHIDYLQYVSSVNNIRSNVTVKIPVDSALGRLFSNASIWRSLFKQLTMLVRLPLNPRQGSIQMRTKSKGSMMLAQHAISRLKLWDPPLIHYRS